MRHLVRAVAAALVVPVLVAAVAVRAAPAPTDGEPPAGEPPPTSRFEPLLPCRLLDTREPHDAVPVDDHTLRIRLDQCDVPDDATAIVATTTVVGTERTGWSVGFPAGIPHPTAATVNWEGPSTRGNTATIAVGDDADGHPAIDVFRSGGNDDGDVVVDVTGAFVPAASSSSGRFVGVSPAQRLLDTRGGDGDDGNRATAGSTRRIPLPEGVDPDATALAVTVTAIRTDGPTYVTAHPAGSDRPLTSMLNTDAADQTRAATAIVPVAQDGFDLFVSDGAHLTVDLTGWFTGDGAPTSADGLFVAVTPRRLRDTRPETHPIHPGGTIEIGLPDDLRTDPVEDDPVDTTDTTNTTDTTDTTDTTAPPESTDPGPGDDEPAVEPEAVRPGAIVVSTTLINADDRGFLTLYPTRTPRPATASAYSLRNDLTAQFAVTSVSDHGLAVFSERGTDVTVDLLGWFTGEAVESTDDAAAPNHIDMQRVLAVGDSTMAGIRWYDAYDPLRGASWTFDGESCRKLARPSCRGREGRVPPTAVDAIESRPDVFDVVVVMTGYNDSAATFDDDVARVMGAARAQGVRRVVWLTYSRELVDDLGGADAWQVFEYQNEYLRWAAPQYDDLVVVEWAPAPRSRPEWFHADGIHVTDVGAYGNADFLARAVAMVTGQPCPVPYPPGDDDGTADGTGAAVDAPAGADDVCADPGERPLPDVEELYDFERTTTQCWEIGVDREVSCVRDLYAPEPDPDTEPEPDPDVDVDGGS